MSYNAEETSLESGAPIELYTFSLGSETFYYTTAEDSFSDSGNTFVPIFIQRTVILYGPENRSQTIDITMKANNEFAQKYIGTQPSNLAIVKIQRVHRFDSADEVVTIFNGQVRAVGFSENGFIASLSVMPLTGAFNRTIPLFTYQSPCNHVLYDVRCKVLESSFTFAGTVNAVSTDGLTLTVNGLDASKGVGWAKGGRIDIATTNDPRLILDHTATDQVKLLVPYRTSPLNSAVNVRAGCDHTLATCKSKFDNVVNFGGFAFVPTRNPFTAGIDQ